MNLTLTGENFIKIIDIKTPQIIEITARYPLTAASEAGTAEAKRPMDGWGRRGLKRCGERIPCCDLVYDTRSLKN